MKVTSFELPPVESGPDRSLPPLLEEGWSAGLAGGAISYDPDEVEPLVLPPFTFHHLPGRESRPRSAIRGPIDGLRRPHSPCPFDVPEFLEKREVLRARGAGRLYHVALNKYPVRRLHYLAIRPAGDPPATLPQRLIGAGEIEDMLRLAASLGHPWRLFFNSNRGADGSRSGSSVNHWHFQVFPDESIILARAPRIEGASGGVEIGRIPDWPARHRLYRSRDGAALAEAVWGDVARIDALDRAYNLEVAPRAEGDLVAALFPRAPTADLELPGAGTLSGDFGGFELSGSVVVPSRPIFEWVQSHPEESAALVRERMRAGTRQPPAASRSEPHGQAR